MKHNMDAITSVFGKINGLRKSIIDLILAQQSNGLNLNSYFYRNAFEYERSQNDFKCSISYVKFVTKIFKLDMPQMLFG